MRWVRVLMIGLSLLALAGCGSKTPRVVLYCGQDREFAESILNDFARETGIQVEVRSDTEADKSVSLYEAIVRESQHPRCDVFWNNEILNTMRLREKDLLSPYLTAAGDPFPDLYKSPDGRWYGFAARARVFLVNNRLPAAERPRTMEDLLDPKWQGRVAMAKPLFGTTATHAVCLFQVWGVEKAKKYFRELNKNVTILSGNKDVAVAVAAGRFDVGLTDTDDSITEARNGRSVTIVYPDRDCMGTLFLPNTVAIIRGGPNPDHARRLVDFLLSPKVENELAEGPSAQIPLNPDIKVNLAVETPQTVKPMQVDFAKATGLWDEAQAFLRDEFARSGEK